MESLRGVRSVNRRSGAGIIFNLLLTALPIGLFYFTYLRFYQDATFFRRGNLLFALLYGFLVIVFLNVYGAYQVRHFRTRELMFSFALASAISNTIMYFVMCLIASRMLLVWGVLLVTLVQWVVAMGLYVLTRMLLPKIHPEIPVLFVREDSDSADELLKKFDLRRTNYTVRDSADSELSSEQLTRAMSHYRTILLGKMDPDTRAWLMEYCFRTGREALLFPDMTDILVGSADPTVVGDLLVYNLNTQGSDMGYLAVKRIVDIVVSALGLVILSPLLLGVSIAIKRQDGGPVFYRQTRLTRGGKPFQLIKFRSMIVNAEKGTGAVLAGKEDDRITPVGRFIRAARIDELPQLWNILKGDMSLVGPRPERPEFYETICREDPEFEYRLKVKAGLTGYAQLFGKYNTTFADKAKLDLYYIQHASILWDLQLIFYTLKIIFIRESTEGVENTVSAAAPVERETQEIH